MAVGKMLQNLTGSATGNNTKAVLCIRRIQSSQINQENNAGIDAMGDNLDSVTTDINNLNNLLLEHAKDSLNGEAVYTWDDISKLSGSYNYSAIEVQYNPTTLRLDTVAGKQLDFNSRDGRKNLSEYNAPSATTLTLELLFDDTNNMDAFMVGDNPLTGMTASNITNTVTSGFKNSNGGYSVQRQIQGLLSLLAVPAARDVIFFWGDMSFHGQVTAVEATYTMFNKKGHPVRGKVLMSIRQADADGEEKGPQDNKKQYDEEYWNEAFDDTFTEEGSGGGILDTVNKFTNNSMLNLKL